MRQSGAPRRQGGLFLGAGALVVFLLLGLGVWQVQRLFWKTALIAHVEQGLSAAPVPVPGAGEWPSLSYSDWEYRRVTASGHFLALPDTLVKAVTVRGSGFWVMTPFATPDGTTLFVNRGFIPADRTDPKERPVPAGQQTITGLFRVSEPGGAFLRSNDPAANRWFSRDTDAMAAARGLDAVAPYFVDLEGDRNGTALPVAGLTVVSFPNNHLVYALTWFSLAFGLAFLLFRIRRRTG